MRIDYGNVAPETLKAMLAADAHFNEGVVPQLLRRLVELRVSQINGCSFCIWLHTKQAQDLGETPERIDKLADWQHSDCFNDAERAAFDWAEAVTRIPNGVPDDTKFERLRDQFDDREVVELTAIAANMNAMNRLAISFRHEAPSK